MPKILVVDDERLLVKGIKFNLENEGYEVETGSDGEEAVELARTGRFDDAQNRRLTGVHEDTGVLQCAHHHAHRQGRGCGQNYGL